MKALLVIDLQNDFLPGGPLGVPDADTLVPLVNELMAHYDLIVATQDWHPENHGSFACNHSNNNIGDFVDLNGLSQILWPSHCIQNSLGANFAPGLDTHRFTTVFRKGQNSKIDSYSGFFDNGHRKSTGLTDYLRAEQVTEVHLCGVATDYCVKFTALDALQEGFKTVLLTDACKGVELQQGDIEKALQEIENAGGVLRTSNEVLPNTVTLFRPIGPNELLKLKELKFQAWPQRLPDQPIFYPVTNEKYARQIAEEWNIPQSGEGFVCRFQLPRTYLEKYPRKIVGASHHEEWWIPAEDLEELNSNLLGSIEILAETL